MPAATENKPRSDREVTQTQNRKDEHIRINIEEDVAFRGVTSGLEQLYLPHCALPELDLRAVDASQVMFGRQLRSPLLISSMTGGTDWGYQLNLRLAEAAQATGVALGLGSMRAALEDVRVAETFAVREVAPDVLLLANLGAVQLNYGYGVEHCRRAVDLVRADGLILHLNPLQEAVQPEGDTNFSGLLRKIEQVARALTKDNIPVVVKEVGWGFSEETARLLAQTGIAAIDVAGAGGTSWSEVEMHRAQSASDRRVAGAFIDWGISTVEAIENVRRGAPDLPVFASGGLRSGVDVAKCIALGASLGGMAGPLLKAANQSTAAVVQEIEDMVRELRIAMFACGAGDLTTLASKSLGQRPAR